MASSSTSSIHNSFKYDVFLSFRGEDTRTNFVDHLYSALQQKSIHTYKDDERITKGKMIGDELIRSIQDSKFYIIVFSRNYASSSWCLDELVKIMECHNTGEHTAYPVFYDVEPTEVRNQRGPVGIAFAKHEKKEAAERWIKAMQEASDLAGWELKNTANGHEAKLIQKIVEEISLEIRSINFSVDEKIIGMETRVHDIVSSLETDINDVHMIGIMGIGGGGKTTLARVVFDQISCHYEGKSFVENVREVSSTSLSGLKSLQNQVLSDVLNDQGINISNVCDGKNMMKRMMRGRKVVLVLDDVNHIEQLEALAGEPSWFKRGSTIIITTRDEQVLVAHRVKLIHNVRLLLDKEAGCLLSRYAFGKEIPIQEYEELSREVVRYANGLPLTIRVLGSFLCGKNVLEWIDAIERLKTIPLMETLKKLELSYMGLEEDYREMFLDVACMLKGWSRDSAIKALESCGFHARNGLRVLEQKSLITNNNNEWVDMHDHLEEMGRNIVRCSHRDKPRNHSRLWNEDEVKEILTNDLGTNATRCMRFYTEVFNPEIVMKGLRKMKELRFLDVSLGLIDPSISDSYRWNSKFNKFPNALRYLRWKYYPFRSLPRTFQANNLVALEMAHSRIVQLWEEGEGKVLNKLRFLDLSHSMLKTLDLRLAPNLEWLDIGTCYDLVEIHMPNGCLKFRYLNLSKSKLRTLDLGLAPNLEKLILENCDNLVELQMPCRCLNLKSLKLTNSKLKTLDIGQTPSLEYLDLKSCYYLEELRMSDECQKLTYLNISHSKLRTLNLGLTPNLKRLDLRECGNLVKVHAPIGCLRKLVYLDLSHCLRFRYFLFDIEYYTCCSVDESLEAGPIAELHLIAEPQERCPVHPYNELPKFQFKCFYQEDRPSLTRNLEMLISVGLCACTNLETFSGSICGLRRLRKLKLKGSISEAPKNLDELECLEELSFLSTNIKHLPDSICMLKYLKSLKLKFSEHLETLPKDLGRLECLEKLTLSYAKIIHLPENICRLTHLKSLKLKFCWCLEKLPEDLGRLESLEKLSLSYAKIKHLPDSICMLEHLKTLKLKFCFLLEKVPEALGQLECLEKLSLSSSMIKYLPESFKVRSSWPLEKLPLEKLPENFGGLEHLEKLSLSSVTVKHLPKSLRTLAQLKILKISEIQPLETLTFGKLSLSDSMITRLPDNMFIFKHVTSLELVNIRRLKRLPKDLGRLECLKELILSSTKITHLPYSICMLKHLKYLELRSCRLLERLPEDLGRLECLEKLILTECNVLRDIPNSICKMKCLKHLNLHYCPRVEKLPDDLGRLECLKVLYLEGACISHLPHSILMLKGLRIDGSRRLLQSLGFTSEIQSSGYEMPCYVVV